MGSAIAVGVDSPGPTRHANGSPASAIHSAPSACSKATGRLPSGSATWPTVRPAIGSNQTTPATPSGSVPATASSPPAGSSSTSDGETPRSCSIMPKSVRNATCSPSDPPSGAVICRPTSARSNGSSGGNGSATLPLRVPSSHHAPSRQVSVQSSVGVAPRVATTSKPLGTPETSTSGSARPAPSLPVTYGSSSRWP